MTNYSATCILSWEVEICVQPLSKHVKASGNQTGESPLYLVLSKLENWTGGLSTTGGKCWERWMGPTRVSQKHNHSFASTHSKWVWPEPHCRPRGTKMSQIPNSALQKSRWHMNNAEPCTTVVRYGPNPLFTHENSNCSLTVCWTNE